MKVFDCFAVRRLHQQSPRVRRREREVKDEEMEDTKFDCRRSKIELNAAIVRILKSRQQVHHNDLIAEIVVNNC